MGRRLQSNHPEEQFRRGMLRDANELPRALAGNIYWVPFQRAPGVLPRLCTHRALLLL